jgi:hypothetical protein
MSSQPAIARAIKIAETKYADHPVIAAILKKLLISRKLAEFEAKDHSLTIAGYRKGLAGKPGYGQLQSFDLSLFDSMAREASRLHETMVITDVLVVALNALGEEIDD